MFLLSPFLVGELFGASYPQDTVKHEKINMAVISAKSKIVQTRQSAPIQIMDKSNIERLGIQELYEAVRTFSGVNIKDYGGVGGLKTVSIRSMGSQHTAVCYDGISISNAQNGQIDISRFTMDNVDEVSITIGQSDDIFQSARAYASAGILNIKSSKPNFSTASSHITLQMKVGSFGTYNPYLLYEQKLGKNWSLTASGDWLTSKGNYPFTLKNGTLVTQEKRLNSDVNIWRGELNLYGDFGKKGQLIIKGNYLNSERGLPGSVVLYNSESTERLWDEIAFVSLNYEVPLGEKWKISTKGVYNYSWNRYLNIDKRYPSGKDENFYTQNEYYISAVAKYSPTEHLHFSLAEDFFVNTLVATIPDCPYPTRYTTLTSVAGQFINDRWSVTASLLGTYLKEVVKVGNAAPERWRLSPSIGASFKVLEDYNFRVRASFKDIFRVPTFNDLYYAHLGNTNLKSEKARQYNVGLTWSGELSELISYCSFTIDGYFNKVKDKIVAIPTMFIWKMLNMGEVNITGVDINTSLTFALPAAMSIKFNANYTFQYAIDVTNPESKNYRNQIPYTPQHSGNMILSWVNRWLNVSYMMTGVGKRYALPQNVTNNLIEGYIDHSISINHTFDIGKCKLRLVGDIQNIGNVNYEVIKYYPMPGRSYKLTLKFIY